MEYPITYLYTLRYVHNNEVFYVGKTKGPKGRLSTHMDRLNVEFHFIMEIVEEYLDEEDKLIVDFYNKGAKIINPHLPMNTEGYYEIGDTFKSYEIRSKTKKVLDKNLNKVWDSLKDCAEHYDVSYQVITNHILRKTKRLSVLLNLEFCN